MGSILPPNATRLELAIEQAAAGAIGFDVPIADLWNPDRCPVDLLPWLAWALSIDVWDSEWPDQVKRRVIRESVEVHRRKGTKASVLKALAAAGYRDAVVEEAKDAPLYGAAAGWGYGAEFEYGYWPEHWAEYRVIVNAPITTRQAQLIRAVLASVQPARCRLVRVTGSLFFTYGDGLWAFGNDIAFGGTYPLGQT